MFIDFHPKCSKLQLSHLCFTDGLLIFSEASVKSVQAIKGVLAEFAELSGLKANPNKSSVFCSGVLPAAKEAVLNCLHMNEGSLPVRYLGVMEFLSSLRNFQL